MGMTSLGALALAAAGQFPAFEKQTIDPNVGKVCYAVTVADVDGDGTRDVVAATEDAVVWYSNPTWAKRDLIRGATERDNVCIQPHDIDGDGKVDFALGAAWRPADTQGGGTLQWLGRKADGAWEVHPIGAEPTLHRLRFGDVKGAGKKQLVVAPLQGRGTKGPNWAEGAGVRILAYDIPAEPATKPWPVEVADDTLHTVHNLWLIDWDDDGREEILLASWEGVFLLDRGDDGQWSRRKLGEGNQSTSPFKGASEIKAGKLGGGGGYLATIEPWHGFQVVVYTPPPNGPDSGVWTRTVIDEPVAWGHGVWCADLDGDADQELIIGQRDPNADPAAQVKGPGIRVYDPRSGSSPLTFDRHLIDDGGPAVEDLVAADLDRDGRPEIIAGGRATHDVVIYWNRGKP